MTHSCPQRRSSDLVGELHAVAELDRPGHIVAGLERLGELRFVGVLLTVVTDQGVVERGEDVAARGTGRVGLGRVDAACLGVLRSEAHTSELQSLMRISYDVFCLNKKQIRRK